jgi:Cdc6-like AAA superfamily ATPase
MNLEELDFDYDRNESLATKNKEVFREDYIPDNILFRDKQILKTQRYLQQEMNVFLLGDISTGKTLVTKQIFRSWNLRKKRMATDYACVYHYCRNTKLIDIYSSIAEQIGYTLQRNIRLHKHSKTIKEFLKKKGIERVYLCLDEVDLLLKMFLEDNELLCDFANDPMYTVILITNHPDFIDKLGSRSIDRLQIEPIKFKNYHTAEIVEILKQRVKLGITNGIISENEIFTIERAIRESKNTLREGIKMIAKIYDHKVFKGIKEPLTEETITKFIDLVTRHSKIQFYKGLDVNLKTTIIIMTEIFMTKKHKKFVTIDDVLVYWNAKAKESSSITSRGYSSIRAYLERLVTMNYLNRTNQKRQSGKRGYVLGYIPIYDVEQFDMYFERKQKRRKDFLKIQQNEARFNDF